MSLLLAVGYRESTAQIGRPTPVQPKRVSFVTGASDTVALSYVCGQYFRVTHTGAVPSDSMMVHWQTTVGDTGSVRLYRKLYGRAFTESIFETPTADSVRISGFGGSLIEANAGRGACTPSRDTTWITAASFAVAGSLVDTTGGLLVNPPYSDTVWSRALRLVIVEGFTRDSIAKVLSTFGVRVVGATPFGGLTVRLDVTRPSTAGLLLLVDSLIATPEILAVRLVHYGGPYEIEADGRDPVKSGRFTRSNWFLRTAQTLFATDVHRTTPVQPQRASFVTGASDTVALSYVCGNHFRVTHTGAVASDSLMVHWRTTVGDTGSVRLYRKLYGRTFTESIFETPTADSVRISGFGGSLIEANAGRGACTPSRDTTWITAASFAVAGSLIDTTGGLLVDPADNDTMWSRSLLLVGEHGFSRDSIAKVLATFRMRVVGATPFGGLTVRLDALRPTASSLLALVDSIDARPEIASVRVASYRGGGSKIKRDGRYPVDSGRLPRSNRTSRNAQEERPPTNP